jgi:hypothetical protein
MQRDMSYVKSSARGAGNLIRVILPNFGMRRARRVPWVTQAVGQPRAGSLPARDSQCESEGAHGGRMPGGSMSWSVRPQTCRPPTGESRITIRVRPLLR